VLLFRSSPSPTPLFLDIILLVGTYKLKCYYPVLLLFCF
jgi:hypothetical protein